jgi:beta-glucanase (GH16 family)
MKMRPLNAMLGLATATLLACSSAPPPVVTGAAGTGSGSGGSTGSAGSTGSGGSTGGAAGQATVGTPGTGGDMTAGAGGTTGTAGSGGTTGAAGAGTGGVAAGGSIGTGGVAAGGSTGTGGATTCPTGVLGHCNADTAAAPTHAGYTLALAEEFDNPIDLNADPIWTWSDGSPADGQTRFRPSQITFTGGKMVITATAPTGCAASTNNAGCIPGGDTSYAEPNKNAQTGTIGNMGVWSGEMRTKYNNYRYGYYEAKYHAPQANPAAKDNINMNGDFLSTMFVFRSPKWQQWNEIDIELEPNIVTELAGNVVNAMGATGYPAGNAAAFAVTQGLPTGYHNYDEHIYAFEWTPTLITWYVDGVVSHTYAGAANDPIPPMSAKIMMNLWVFSGTAFGAGVNNKFPFSSEYEYFRFYKSNSETTYPCSPTPMCLPFTDLDFAQNNAMETNYTGGKTM